MFQKNFIDISLRGKIYKMLKGEMCVLGLFTPNDYISSFQKLNIAKLQSLGIRALVCDIDNTLVAHDEPDPNHAVIQFIASVHDAGLDVILVSNNVNERVQRFAKGLGVEVRTYPFAKKPLKVTYQKMMKDTGYTSKEIAVLGDQLLTDILGANRVHFYTILTNPVAQKDLTCTKINRIFENMVFKLLEISKRLKKGVFHDEM